MPRYAKKSTSRRPYRKRVTTRRKYSKKKYAKRAKVTNRRIANVASTKKSDTMVGAFGSDGTWNKTAITTIAADGNYHSIGWCPTARYRSADENQRNRATVYMKGIAENILLTTNSDVPWVWRRIVFRTTDIYSQFASLDTNDTTLKTYYRNMNVDQTQNPVVVEDLLTGYNGTDWVDPLNGKVNTQKYVVLEDKVRMITTASTRGVFKKIKKYYGINKNFTYDDEENGGGESSSPWGVMDTSRGGNVYIFDMIRSASAVAGSNVTLRVQSTLFWHEK